LIERSLIGDYLLMSDWRSVIQNRSDQSTIGNHQSTTNQ